MLPSTLSYDDVKSQASRNRAYPTRLRIEMNSREIAESAYLSLTRDVTTLRTSIRLFEGRYVRFNVNHP